MYMVLIEAHTKMIYARTFFDRMQTNEAVAHAQVDAPLKVGANRRYCTRFFALASARQVRTTNFRQHGFRVAGKETNLTVRAQ